MPDEEDVRLFIPSYPYWFACRLINQCETYLLIVVDYFFDLNRLKLVGVVVLVVVSCQPFLLVKLRVVDDVTIVA